MEVVKKAVLRWVDRVAELCLFRVEPKVYRWVYPNGQELDHIDYLTDADAIAALRVLVDGDPAYVGCDLTVNPVTPPPELRAARRVMRRVGAFEDETLEAIRNLIQEETGIGALLDASQALFAYIWKYRPLYARTLFPHVEGKPPRDLTLDGLLLTYLEAAEKSLGESLDNLKAVLREPVSEIIGARQLPQKQKGKVN